MRADQLLLERRIDEIEALWLEGATRNQIIAFLQEPTPLPTCKVCVTCSEPCTHGPPRWSTETGDPMPVRTILWYLHKAKTRMFALSLKQRAHNRIITLGQINRSIARCFRENQLKELATFLRFRSELDGTKVAAEEAEEPTLFEQVRSQMTLCEDYEPGPKPKTKQKYSALQARFLLEQQLHLLQKADVSTAEYRKANKPKNDVEARLYLRRQLVEAVDQALTNPTLTPEGKRDALQKLGATYAMVSKDADLVEHLTELKEMLQVIQTKI